MALSSDFLVIGISMVFSLMLGFLWYGPLFGKPWMELSDIKMPEKRPSMAMMLKPMLLSFLGSGLMAFALVSTTAFHNAYWGVTGYAAGLSFAFFLWLCFVVPVYLNLSGWEGKPWTLFFINTGYWLVFLLVSASILVLLQSTSNPATKAGGESSGKLNINVVCEGALAYMTFPDGASADAFVNDCKEGKHPEVIERYKAELGLDGAVI